MSSVTDLIEIGKNKIDTIARKPENMEIVKTYQNFYLRDAGIQKTPVSINHPLYSSTFSKASFQWYLEQLIEELQNLFGDATYDEEVINGKKDVVPVWPEEVISSILKFTEWTEEEFIILTKYTVDDSYIRYGLNKLKRVLYKVTGALEERGMMN